MDNSSKLSLEKIKNSTEELRKKFNSQAIGSIIGSLSLGPAGALLGPIIAAIIEQVLEGKTKEKSDWETLRIKQLLFCTEEKLKDFQKNNKKLRSDLELLLDPKNNYNDKPHLSEIFEAAVVACENEYEERKIKLYANLFANIHISNGLGKSQIIQLIQIVKSLSWQQICLISLAGNEAAKLHLRGDSYEVDEDKIEPNLRSLLFDLKFLCNNDLVNSNDNFILNIGEITPSKLKTVGIGSVLYDKMNLSEITQDEMKSVTNLLK